MAIRYTAIGALALGMMVVGCGDDAISSATDATDSDTSSTSTSSTSSTSSSTGPETTTTTTTTTTDTTTTTSDTTTTTTSGPGTESDTDVTATDTTTDTDTDGPTCEDGLQNGDESDVDCGGSCLPCADGLLCNDAPDCVSGNCLDGICAPNEQCNNGQLDDGESDVDCGGLCGPCEAGQMCLGDEDCLGACVDGFCDATECLEDVDCEGMNGECAVYACVESACVPEAINEGGDCGGDDLCSSQNVCTAGVCGGGVPVDCSDLDNACTVGLCNPEDGQCIAEVAPNDTPCQAALGCGDAAVCTDGACIDPDGEAFFYEPFSNNDNGWTLGTEWEIGPAVAGCGDPDTDHSPGDDNGVAGVVLGGCATTALHDYYCLTSPVFNASEYPGQDLWLTFYRDLYSDYTPYMKNKIEVLNKDGTWVTVYETFGAPGINDSEWTYQEYDLNALKEKNEAMQIRWCNNIGNGGAFNRGSWNIDDVVLGPAMCQPY